MYCSAELSYFSKTLCANSHRQVLLLSSFDKPYTHSIVSAIAVYVIIESVDLIPGVLVAAPSLAIWAEQRVIWWWGGEVGFGAPSLPLKWTCTHRRVPRKLFYHNIQLNMTVCNLHLSIYYCCLSIYDPNKMKPFKKMITMRVVEAAMDGWALAARKVQTKVISKHGSTMPESTTSISEYSVDQNIMITYTYEKLRPMFTWQSRALDRGTT